MASLNPPNGRHVFRGISIKELAAAAVVHRADLHRWRKGQIPDTSAKAQRIEAVLQRAASK